MFRSVALALMLLTSSSRAGELNLLHFRGEGMALLQVGGNLFTGSLSWNPLWSFERLEPSMLDIFAVRLHLGAFALKNQTNDISVAADGQALWATRFQTTSLEIGPGVQYFVGQGGARFTINGNLVFELAFLRSFWGILHSAVIGYTALVDSTYFTNQIRAGIGFQL